MRVPFRGQEEFEDDDDDTSSGGESLSGSSSSDSSSDDDGRRKRRKSKKPAKVSALAMFNTPKVKPVEIASSPFKGKREPHRVAASGAAAMTKRIKELMDENTALREEIAELKLQCDEAEVTEGSAHVDALAALTSVVYGTVKCDSLPLFAEMSTESTTVAELGASDPICLVHPVTFLEDGSQWMQCKHVDKRSAESTLCHVCVRTKTGKARVGDYRA